MLNKLRLLHRSFWFKEESERFGASGQPVESNVFEGVDVILKKSAGFVGWDYESISYGNMNVPGAILETDAEQKVKALAQKYAK